MNFLPASLSPKKERQHLLILPGLYFLIFVVVLFSGSAGCVSNQEADPEYLDRSKVCSKCHEDHYALWVEGGHAKVLCERCHGTAKGHILEDIAPRPKMRLNAGADLCLSCHGRSGSSKEDKIPQVSSLAAHLKFIGEKHSVVTDIKKTKGRCTFCHDPHSLE